MALPHSPKQNHILAALPVEDYAGLKPDPEPGSTLVGCAVYESCSHIKVLDRAKLEKRVCKCRAVVKKEYDRLLPFEIRALQTTTPWHGEQG